MLCKYTGCISMQLTSICAIKLQPAYLCAEVMNSTVHDGFFQIFHADLPPCIKIKKKPWQSDNFGTVLVSNEGVKGQLA